MGWQKESERHSLAKHGIKTKQDVTYPSPDEGDGCCGECGTTLTNENMFSDFTCKTCADKLELDPININKESSDNNKDIWKMETPESTELWFKINNYMFFTGDPKYDTLVSYRKKIEKIENDHDRNLLIKYFNETVGDADWNGMKPVKAWDYYKEYDD
jgi:hypothetical protein